MSVPPPGAVFAPPKTGAARRGEDTAPYLRRAVEALGQLRQKPHALVMTGDLTDFGRAAEYEHLASLLAGPVIKGDAGRAEGKRCEAMAVTWLTQAKNSDSAQRRVNPTHSVGWIAGR